MNDGHQTAGQKKHWAGIREAGTLRGILFMAWLQNTFGRKVFSIILYPVAIYFYLLRPIARQASMEVLQTHYKYFPDQWQRKPSTHDVIMHFYAFGQSILDKLLAWTTAISREEFEFDDESALSKLVDSSKGRLIIGSHFGNLEYCRGFVQRNKIKVINALVYDRNSANYVEMMKKLNPESRIHIYQVDELDIPLILKLQNKLSNGEWLFIAGDRLPLSGEQNTVEVDFMGRRANLPIGPYILARSLGCEVDLMFSYRRGRKVRFAVYKLADKVELPHKDRHIHITRYAQFFAEKLEQQCRQAPTQWFNFYPFWTDSKAAGKPVTYKHIQDS